jgi:hypothetical protein
MTTQTRANQGLFNFETAFTEHKPEIERPNYKNPNRLLHNNVGKIMLAEQIREYRININSADRNITTYPNQFNFKVKFGGVGTNTPIIPRVFKNVKFIKLDEVRLPKAFHIEDSGGGNWVVSTGTDYQFINEMYVVVKIPEIGRNNVYGTRSSLSDNSFVLIYDKVLGEYYTDYLTSNNVYSYPDDGLIDLSNMTIQLMNVDGTIYEINDKSTSVAITDVRNPLNAKLQIGLSFIIGCMQNEIDTDTTYG